ncbi:MAG: galactokinase [Bacteroidetes bacterium]|nr:galactokinase [Bacteroidota bacterium]
MSWSSELAERFQTLALAHTGPDAREAMVLNVPGRIEVLGKHTDYAGGPSLTCASSLSMAAVVTTHDQPFLLVVDAARGTQVEFPYDNPLPTEGQSWTLYVCAVLKRLIRHFGTPERGVSIVLSSQLPSASGMSSSSGLIITIALSLLGMGKFANIPRRYAVMSRERFAGFAGALESGADFEELKGDKGVGTKGGSEDHTAILCSSLGAFNLYTYFPVQQVGTVTLPGTVRLVVASSGVVARKTGEAKDSYNLASRRARRVVHLWNESAPEAALNMGEMVAHESFDRNRLREVLNSDQDGAHLWHRFMQFDQEVNVIIPGAIDALRRGEWSSFGRFIDESQKMAHEWLGNQVPETNDLVRLARNLGAYGASAFGAGFGGAVWAIVDGKSAEHFCTQWKTAYAEGYPARMSVARFFLDRPSVAAIIQGAQSFRFEIEEAY